MNKPLICPHCHYICPVSSLPCHWTHPGSFYWNYSIFQLYSFYLVHFYNFYYCAKVLLFFFSIFFKRICDCLLKYLDGKDPDAGQDWRKKERVDGITDSMDMNWSKLWETAEDGGAWCTAVRGVTKSRTQLSTDDNKMMVALKKYQIILTSDSSQCWLVVLCFLLQFFFLMLLGLTNDFSICILDALNILEYSLSY